MRKTVRSVNIFYTETVCVYLYAHAIIINTGTVEVQLYALLTLYLKRQLDKNIFIQRNIWTRIYTFKGIFGQEYIHLKG